jgi:hypothetical protein
MLAVDAGTVWSAVGASTVVSAGVSAATSLLGQRWEFTRRLGPRRQYLRLQHCWPRAALLGAAFERLRALPAA